MKIISRYLSRDIIGSILISGLAMMGMVVFILFVNELDAIGEGNYGVWQALYFVTLQIPQLLYQFFPMIALMGSLFALGVFAAQNELTVMRAAGISILQISMIVLKAALVLILLVTFVGEMFVPKLTYKSENYKAIKTSAGQAVRSGNGMWTRVGSNFIYIGSVVNQSHLRNIQIFTLQRQRVTQTLLAKSARFEAGNWHLYQVEQSVLQPDNQLKLSHYAKKTWDIDLNPRLLKISSLAPNEMTVSELQHFVRGQRANHIQAGQYELALWDRLVQPASTAVMMLLAIPFVFGSTRETTMGARLVLGVVVGFTFYMLNRFFGPMSLVFQIPPIFAAILPTVLFAILAIVLFSRVRI